MIAVLVLFSVTALVGLTLAARRLRERPRQKVVAIIHGGLAMGTLITLMALSTGVSGTILAITSIAMFVVGAVLGFCILAFAVMKQEQPVPLIVIHGMATASGIGLLAMAIMGYGGGL